MPEPVISVPNILGVCTLFKSNCAFFVIFAGKVISAICIIAAAENVLSLPQKEIDPFWKCIGKSTKEKRGQGTKRKGNETNFEHMDLIFF